METKTWNDLPIEKRGKAADLIAELSTINVSWNESVQKNLLEIYSKFTTECREEYKLKPHELIVISRMLQEYALSDLYEWLPSDFEDWNNKDELMAMFFFGEKGLESYREKKDHSIKS